MSAARKALWSSGLRYSRTYSSCAPRPTRSRQERSPIAYHFLQRPIPYDIGLQLQEDILDTRVKWRAQRKDELKAENARAMDDGEGDVILLLEHTPTYTTGRRDLALTSSSNHREQAKMLHSGATFHQTKRGGQVTYHGMGQLVGYPILDIGSGGMSLSARCYVDYIQSVLASYARATLGPSADVHAPHPNSHVGVFIGEQEKLASIGIQIRHRITSHGFAINVTREPIPWFDLVTACGLNDVRATSLQGVVSGEHLSTSDEMSDSPLSVKEVANGMMPFFGDKFDRRMMALPQLVDMDVSGKEVWQQIQHLIAKAEEQAKERVASSPVPRRPLSAL